MRTGFWILTAFGLVWSSGPVLMTNLPAALLLVPVVLLAALLWWAMPRIAVATDRTSAAQRRRVRLWSGVEVLLIVAAAYQLPRLGMTGAVMPAIAIIVGAHFLPLARGLGVRFYLITGSALIALGIAAFAVPPGTIRILFTGWGAAAILWASAARLAHRATGATMA